MKVDVFPAYTQWTGAKPLMAPLALAITVLLASPPAALHAQDAPSQELASWGMQCPAIDERLKTASLSPKRGLGVSAHYAGASDVLSFLQTSWYYTWTARSVAGAQGEFVPLLQYPRSARDVETLRDQLGSLSQETRHLLGFNEPDYGPRLAENGPPGPDGQLPTPNPRLAEAKQDLLLQMIPEETRAGMSVGSPALASPVLGGASVASWLKTFVDDEDAQDAGRVGFIAIHLYASVSSESGETPQQKVDRAYSSFARRLRLVEQAFPDKKIWVTEMGFTDLGATRSAPAAFTAADDACLMARVLPLLDADPRVERYAWFSADPDAAQPLYPTLPGALWSAGQPTALALLYR